MGNGRSAGVAESYVREQRNQSKWYVFSEEVEIVGESWLYLNAREILRYGDGKSLNG